VVAEDGSEPIGLSRAAVRVLGLEVEGEDGTRPPGLSRAFLRLLGYGLSACLFGIGFLMIAFSGRALHDRIAGTRVVKREMA
jgi:uncharacterized RDD family membrane protein YckC